MTKLCTKIFEKIIARKTIDYLTKNHLLDPFQTGFLPSLSTQSTLLKLIDDIRLNIDSKFVTLLVLFDFTKAFDRVYLMKSFWQNLDILVSLITLLNGSLLI